MKLENLNLTDAPQAGQLLAYTRKEVVFGKYESLTQVEERLCDQELLEIHLFDDDREYRAAASRSGRFETCETLADFPESGEQVYKEEVLLENAFMKEGQTITVLNHISYDERGMAVVDNYRLKMGGKRHG